MHANLFYYLQWCVCRDWDTNGWMFILCISLSSWFIYVWRGFNDPVRTKVIKWQWMFAFGMNSCIRATMKRTERIAIQIYIHKIKKERKMLHCWTRDDDVYDVHILSICGFIRGTHIESVKLVAKWRWQQQNCTTTCN